MSRLFARAIAATRDIDCEVNALAFDATYGYPSNYYADCGEEGSGEEVRCFEPNTLNLDVCGTR